MDAALPSGVNYGPAERAQRRASEPRHLREEGRARLRLHPQGLPDDLHGELEGAVRLLPVCGGELHPDGRTKDGGGSGWAGITGVKDTGLIDPVQLTETRRRQGAQEPEGARARAGPLHRDPRAAARRALPLADDGTVQRAARPRARCGNYFSGKERGTTKIGEKVFSEQFTLKSDIGNPILRQTPIGTDGLAGARRHLGREGRAQEPLLRPPVGDAAEEGADAGLDQQQPGAGRLDMTIAEMIKTTKRGLLVTFFWYIRRSISRRCSTPA